MAEKTKTVKIKLVHSIISKPKDQVRTVNALGFKRTNQVIEKPVNDAIIGMIYKVQHLVKIVK